RSTGDREFCRIRARRGWPAACRPRSAGRLAQSVRPQRFRSAAAIEFHRDEARESWWRIGYARAKPEGSAMTIDIELLKKDLGRKIEDEAVGAQARRECIVA